MFGKAVLILFLSCIMAPFTSSVSCEDATSAKAALSEAEIRQQISLINQRIKELQERKKHCEARALSAAQTANRLQYVDFLTARTYYVQEEHFTAKANEAQREIDALKRKKEELEQLVQ